jgi:WD40 repeat protein
MGENDSIITSGSADGEVRLWDLRFDSFNPSFFLSGHNNRITGLTPLVIIILLYLDYL